jgi:hypothetical protein
MAAPSEPVAAGEVEDSHGEGDDAGGDVEDVEHRALLATETGD